MTERLTDEELDALAGALHTPVSAAQLLERAGLKRSRHPSWAVRNAAEFWGEVNDLLQAGVLADGRRRILTAAVELYPGNPVFVKVLRTPRGTPRGTAGSTPGEVLWGPVPPQNLFFTGREQALADLHARLTGGAGPVAGSALAGVGGVGKTQLAAEYAHRHAAAYRLVWWISAETPTQAEAGLASLADALRLPPGESTRRRARLWEALAGRDDWLLVYDNAHPDSLAATLPPRVSGRVLVTSRARLARPPRLARLPTVDVDVFDRAESVALLHRHLPDLPTAAADRLAAALGDLPSAVDQAGTYLTDASIGGVDAYLERLASRQHPVLNNAPRDHPGFAATGTGIVPVAGSGERPSDEPVVEPDPVQPAVDQSWPELIPVPGHTVLLSRTLVTNRQFRAFLSDSANAQWRPLIARRSGRVNRDYLRTWEDAAPDVDDHPVVNVGVDAAQAYLNWASGRMGRVLRLPGEAEWLLAAQAGRMGDWVGEDVRAGLVNYRDTLGRLARIGEFGANPAGFYDLLGQVWEICLDEAGLPVLRGGAFNTPEALLLDRLSPSSQCRADAGFRCAGEPG